MSKSTLVTVNPDEAKALIKMQMSADPKNRIAIGLIGHMGEGKSQVVQQAAAENGWNYVDLRGSQMEATDFLGIPFRDEAKNTTSYAKPMWWPADGTKTVLVLEEVNRAALDVQQAVMQILNEGKVGVHSLPTDTVVCVCINPPNDVYQVSELDPAMHNRAGWYDFKSDPNVWLKYAFNTKVHDDVIRFVGLKPDMLSVPLVGEPCPTPRTWVMVSHALKSMSGPLLDKTINALIGTKTAVTFKMMTAKGFKIPVRGIEVFDNYPAVKERVKNQDMPENTYTIGEVVASVESIKMPKEKLVNLIAYFHDCPAEWQGKLISDLPQRILARMCGQDPTLAPVVQKTRAGIEAMLADE